MCRRILLILWTLAAAAGAYFLRTAQLPFPVSDSLCRAALWTLLGTAIAVSALLSIPEKEGRRMSELHTVPVGISLQGSGALLIAASAVWQLYLLYPTLRSFAAIEAAALLIGGFGLFGGMAACSRQKSKSGSLLLLPLCAAALHLIAAYWESSIDPNLRHYDMRILFLAAAAISIGLLTDFVFADGKRRLTLVFLSLSVTLAGAFLPSAASLPRLFAIMGTAFTALGYLVTLLFGFEPHTTITYELVEDPFSTGRVRTTPPAPDTDSFAGTSPAEKFTPASFSLDETPAPSSENGILDLSRVDRLLLELEDEGKQRK